MKSVENISPLMSIKRSLLLLGCLAKNAQHRLTCSLFSVRDSLQIALENSLSWFRKVVKIKWTVARRTARSTEKRESVIWGNLLRYNVILKPFPHPPLLGRFGKDNAKTNEITKAQKWLRALFGAQFAPLALVKQGFISSRAVVATVALTLLNLPILRYVPGSW